MQNSTFRSLSKKILQLHPTGEKAQSWPSLLHGSMRSRGRTRGRTRKSAAALSTDNSQVPSNQTNAVADAPQPAALLATSISLAAEEGKGIAISPTVLLMTLQMRR